MDSIISAFKEFWTGSGNFEGKMSKEEFWQQIWPNAVPGLILYVLSMTLGRDHHFIMIVFSIYYLVFLIPLFSAMSRRLNDAGCSRWNMIWFFVSCIGWLILAYKLSKPSVMPQFSSGAASTAVYPVQTAGKPSDTASAPVQQAAQMNSEPAAKQTENVQDDAQQDGYLEKYNVGTRHDTLSKASAYWMIERPGMTVKPQFTMYRLASADDAEAALLEMPFIHKAEDSGNLICDRLMTYGYYDTGDGSDLPYEALIAGTDFTLDEDKKAEQSFEDHGGKLKNHLEPSASVKAPAADGDASKVVYSTTEKGNDGVSVYQVYKAPDKACAIAFLKKRPVTQKLYYIVVDTPEGSFGRDINGLYQE